MASEKIDALELDITSNLNTGNLDKVIAKLGELSKALDKLKGKSVTVNLKETGDAAKTASTSVDKLSSSFLNQAIRVTALISIMKKLSSVITTGIADSMAYVENLNLFTVSLGEYSESANKYAETVRDAMGIDPSNWIRTQGVFNTLIKGFGVTGDKAAYMSQNLTQLTYDVASFYNLSIKDAEKKLQSAVAGELEPVRRLGYDLSQSKLTAIAQNPANYGKTTYSINAQTGAVEANTRAIDQNTNRKIANFNQLTQGEKVQLRYIALMTQVTQVQGDMARTLNDPANQMRIFKEQTTMTARALGDVFIPALNKVLPYVTAFFQILESGFRSLAGLFGFKLPDMSKRMDASKAQKPYENIVKSTGKAKNNAKKLKDYMLGIDELNVFRPDSGIGGAGGGGVGDGNPNLKGLKTPGYDFLGKAIENSIKKAKENIEKLFADLKKNPFLLKDLFTWGAGEIGSKIWEKILGKTPEQLKAEAAEHGRTVGEEFIVQLAYKIKGGVEDFQTNFWTWVFGKSPDELAKEADERGVSVGTAFYGGLAEKIPGLPGSVVESVPFMDALFGTPEELARRASEAGHTVGEQFVLELGKMANQYLKTQPILKFFYEKLSGRSVDADIAALDKAINAKAKPKKQNTASDYRYVSADRAKRLATAQKGGIDYGSLMPKGNEIGGDAFVKAEKNGKAYGTSYARGLDSTRQTVGESANGLFKSGYNGINDNGTGESKYKYVSADQAKAYYSNLGTKADKTTADNNSKAMAVAGGKGAAVPIKDFKKAGENSSLGYIKGIAKHISKAGQKGADLGAAALKALKKELKTNSPSKAFAEIGMYSAQGYANAVDKYSYLASDATTNMATKALSAMTNASDISNSIINGTIADPMASRKVNMPSTTGIGYGVGMANADAMSSLASSVYQAVVSGMNIVADSINDRDINVLIDGKAVFKTVQTESRKRGVAISNGTFGR